MSNLNASNRIMWIDQYRAILFLFVIMVHTDRSPFWLRSCYDFFYLPGFFFLSGYLFKEKTYKESIKGIVNSLLIPLVLFYLILSLIILISTGDIILSTQSFINKILIGDIWFIPCLIVIELIFYTFYYFVFKHRVFPMMLLLLASVVFYFYIVSFPPDYLPWNFDTACWCLMYYILGAMYRKLPLSISKSYSYSTFIIYCFLAVILSYYGIAGGGEIDIHFNYVYNSLTYLFLSIFGTFSSFWLASYIPVNKYLSKFGQYTLFAFPFHVIIYQKTSKLLENIGIDNLIHNDFLFVLMITAYIFVVLYIICGFLMRYAPILLGKYKLI